MIARILGSVCKTDRLSSETGVADLEEYGILSIIA